MFIDGLSIIPSSYVLNIGVTLDSKLSLNSHIANISKSTNYNFIKICRIRKDLTRPLTTILIKSLLLFHIDYCSSLVYHLPDISLHPLNRIIRVSICQIYSPLIGLIITLPTLTNSTNSIQLVPFEKMSSYTFNHSLIK